MRKTPAQALQAQARAHRCRGARRPIPRHADAEQQDPSVDQLDMFTGDATTEQEN